MVEQSTDTIGKAFKSSVSSPPVFLQTSVKILTDFLEACVNVPTVVLEAFIDSLLVFLETSVNVPTDVLEASVNQLMGAVKSGLDSPKGGVFAILSLLEERVDVGCQFHELLVDVGP